MRAGTTGGPHPRLRGRAPLTASWLRPTYASASTPRAFWEAHPAVSLRGAGPGGAAEPDLALPGNPARRVRGVPGQGRAGSAAAGRVRPGVCACSPRRPRLGVGFVRMCSHLRTAELWGEPTSALAAPDRTGGGWGRPGRGFPGLCGPTGAGPGRSWRPAQTLGAGTCRDGLSGAPRGGCLAAAAAGGAVCGCRLRSILGAASAICAGPCTPRGWAPPRASLRRAPAPRSGPAAAGAQSRSPGVVISSRAGVPRAASDAGGSPGSGRLEGKPAPPPPPPDRLPASLPACGRSLHPGLPVVAPALRRARREVLALRGGGSFPPRLSPVFWCQGLQPEASGARSCPS